MARRVFFSFHYKRDVWRVNQVRNSWVTKPSRETAGFIDAAEFEKIKKKGKKAVEKWIDEQLQGTSVTIVLIGNQTSERDYVKYEIQQSLKKNNGFVGIYIHRLKDKEGNKDTKGNNPLDDFYYTDDYGRKKKLSNKFKTYYWDLDDGYENLGKWVEEAIKIASR